MSISKEISTREGGSRYLHCPSPTHVIELYMNNCLHPCKNIHHSPINAIGLDVVNCFAGLARQTILLLNLILILFARMLNFWDRLLAPHDSNLQNAMVTETIRHSHLPPCRRLICFCFCFCFRAKKLICYRWFYKIKYKYNGMMV